MHNNKEKAAKVKSQQLFTLSMFWIEKIGTKSRSHK